MRGTSVDSRPGPDLRVLDGVAGWCGGLHGAMALGEALKSLAVGLNADAAALSRHHHRSEVQPRTVALYDDGQGIRRAYSQDVLGYLFEAARAGTAWFISDLLYDTAWKPTRGLASWMAARRIEEIVVIPLVHSAQQADYIEFHFARSLAPSERAEIEALVPTIVRSWAGRKPGLVTQAVADERLMEARTRARQSRADWEEPVLGMSNPAGLSRAEFRVCLLLSRGLSVKGVADGLGLSENTVRSHLRAIYAKTETSGLAELLYRILSAGREETANLPRRARG
jgi:DNA-binding CsgD family transcriptional regulator